MFQNTYLELTKQKYKQDLGTQADFWTDKIAEFRTLATTDLFKLENLKQHLKLNKMF